MILRISQFLACVSLVVSLDCFNGNINSYTGDIDVSNTGSACMQWDNSTLKSSNLDSYRRGIKESDGTLEISYCRVPDRSAEQPWCYVRAPSKWEYCDIPICDVGCFQDKENDRDIPNQLIASGALTRLKCRNHCIREGFIYSAVQAGQFCMCGNTYGRHGALDDSECQSICTGSVNETCGGDATNTVLFNGHICMESNPCENGARCEPVSTSDKDVLRTGGGYKCSCQPGYSGRNCSKVTSCDAKDFCSNGGKCNRTEEGVPYCECPERYKETTNCRMCESITCLNGGTCRENKLGMVKCQCPLEFTGENCEKKRDFCDPNPCLSGGTCKRFGFTYKCVCPANFEGQRCEQASPAISDKLCYQASCLGPAPCLGNDLQKQNQSFCYRDIGQCFIHRKKIGDNWIKWQAGCVTTCNVGRSAVDDAEIEVIQCCTGNKCNGNDYDVILARSGGEEKKLHIVLIGWVGGIQMLNYFQ